MQEKELKRGYRNAWFLALLGLVYVVIFYALATSTSPPGEDSVQWNMGGTEFVPASSPEAEGYYKPVTEEDWLEFGKEGAE
jgi:hypothetical protein